MAKYLLFTIPVPEGEQREIISAFLMNMPFQGILENTDDLVAYVPNSDWKRSDLKSMDELANRLDFKYDISEEKDKNWNSEWEKSYPPVVIDDIAVIRAPFHEKVGNKKITEIVISPQMAFGTGHHPTTELMLIALAEQKVKNKRVLDYGAGSGILSIAADKWGAKKVVAVEIDKKAYENLVENIEINKCKNIEPVLGTLKNLNDKKYHIILANINRNQLLDSAKALRKKCKSKATLILSGLLAEDQKTIVQEYKKHGFKLKSDSRKLDWICLLFEKK